MAALAANDMPQARQLFSVLCELNAKDSAVAVYIEYISASVLAVPSQSDEEDEIMRFLKTHGTLIAKITDTFKVELLMTEEGRVLSVFGASLWYRVAVELTTTYFLGRYKQFLQEALDTEGKSK